MKNEKYVSNKILEITKKISKNKKISFKSELIGSSSFIDSMTLVQLCITLEDFSNKLKFEFDWTSEKAMSRSQSIFRNVDTLSKEFLRQMKKSK
tara:strand:- start:229 stop:510 length:282 start_codon:yes stop_codon:yes gene_type:complete